MALPSTILTDSGPIAAFYNSADRKHQQICDFFARCHSRIVTTSPIISEVMWLLAIDWRVQNEFLSDLSRGVFDCEPMVDKDFAAISEIISHNPKAQLDFADYSLLAVAERLNIMSIACFDKDFEAYKRFGRIPLSCAFREESG
jgi:predicted nucleic acid-binding protein